MGIFDGFFSKAPEAPDYAALAEQTAASDAISAENQLWANRPDLYGPEGQRTWEVTSGDVFDQTGWDAANQTYQTDLTAYQNQPPPSYSGGGGGAALDGDPSWMGNTGMYSGPTLRKPTAPNRADFTSTGNPDKWTGTTTLTPEGQKAFDSNERTQTGLAGLGETAVGQIEDLFSTPFNIEGQAPAYQGPAGEIPRYQGPEGAMPTYGEHRQGVVDAMRARVDTDIGRARERDRSNLIAQGIPVSSEAYGRESERLDRRQTDAYQQAEIAAEQMAGIGYSSALAGRGMQNTEAMNDFSGDMASRGMGSQESMADYTTGMGSHQQSIQDALLNRQTPLNEINALMSGSQVNMPSFQNYGNQQFTGGADYLGAGQMQGAHDIATSNQDIAQKNTLYNGMFDLGSAGISAWGLRG